MEILRNLRNGGLVIAQIVEKEISLPYEAKEDKPQSDLLQGTIQYNIHPFFVVTLNYAFSMVNSDYAKDPNRFGNAARITETIIIEGLRDEPLNVTKDIGIGRPEGLAVYFQNGQIVATILETQRARRAAPIEGVDERVFWTFRDLNERASNWPKEIVHEELIPPAFREHMEVADIIHGRNIVGGVAGPAGPINPALQMLMRAYIRGGAPYARGQVVPANRVLMRNFEAPFNLVTIRRDTFDAAIRHFNPGDLRVFMNHIIMQPNMPEAIVQDNIQVPVFMEQEADMIEIENPDNPGDMFEINIEQFNNHLNDFNGDEVMARRDVFANLGNQLDDPWEMLNLDEDIVPVVEEE